MNYHTLGKKMIEDPPIKAAMHTRDLMSATLSLSEMPAEQLKAEIDDIELAHARLSTIIQRITRG